ncbi:MAG: 2-oxoacid:acceptor oxidoreductase family protein [Candidatus Omnitrophica bacterium]|nr:2-oxoacid:acceptor oxidoreductase family protein [Candidatus Omnitrophota bacterium]
MTEEIICAGFGGQGIMILGKLMAYSAMRKNFNVTWMPSYGAEVRGGTAHCMVVISDKEVASPVISLYDTAIIMNKPSLDKFIGKIRPKGTLILNSSLVDGKIKRKDISVLRIPFTDIAHKLGNIRVANVIAFGVYMSKKKLFSKEIAKKGITIAFGGNKELVSLNIRALEEGLKVV